MSDSLTTLIANVQATLGDSAGTYFTTALCTAALRAALSEINERAPRSNAETFSAETDILEYDLTAVAPTALHVLKVFLNDTDGQQDTPIKFDSYRAAGALYFRTRDEFTNETISCIYSYPHTVNGLDGETVSSLPAVHDRILEQGACYHALLALSVGRTLANNIQSGAVDDYRESAKPFRARFDAGLDEMAKQNSFTSEPDNFAWNDRFHGGIYG